MLGLAVTLLVAASSAKIASAQYSATYEINNLPNNSEQGQSGTNECTTTNSDGSTCQTLVVNSIEDFCLWAPPEPNSAIGDTEQIEVAWCTKNGHGTRTIPQGALTGVHFVQTPDYVQITGVGNLALMNINNGGGGGELDPHGATGLGNPIGGLVFSDAFGEMQQIHEWTNYMSENEFCMRACKPGPNAYLYCNHIYDVMGCEWVMPANYDDDVLETCIGDSDVPMGLYSSDGNTWGSTFHQGQAQTPSAMPAAASSSCSSLTNLGLGAAAPTLAFNGTAISSSSKSSLSSPIASSIASTTLTTTSTSTSTSAPLVITTVTTTSISSTAPVPTTPPAVGDLQSASNNNIAAN